MSTFGRSEARQILEFDAPTATVAKACQEVLANLGEVIATSPAAGSIQGIVKRGGFFGYDTDIMIQVYKNAEAKTTLTINASRERFAATPNEEASVDLIRFTDALMRHPNIRNTTSDRIGWEEEKTTEEAIKSTALASSPNKASNRPLIWALVLLGLFFASCCCLMGLYQILSRLNL